jgi:hypothetical protein
MEIANLYNYISEELLRDKLIIKNKAKKIISTEEIEKCIDLLHEDYKTLNPTIRVFKNKIAMIPELLKIKSECFDDYKYIMSGNTHAQYNSNSNLIDIFIFNHLKRYKNKEERRKYLKLYIIFNLYHELRHSYQDKYKNFKFEKERKHYISYGNGYKSQWIERDANRFAVRMMEKHRENINEILGVTWDWNITW